MRIRDIDQKTKYKVIFLAIKSNSVAYGFDLVDEKSFSKFLKKMGKNYDKLNEKMELEADRTKDDQISLAKANQVFHAIVKFFEPNQKVASQG